MKTKILSLALILALLACVFAGCGDNSADSSDPTGTPQTSESPDPQESGAPSEGDSDAEVQAAADQARYDKAFAAHESGDVVMTIQGRDVIWSDFYYWIFTAVYSLETSPGVTDWNETIPYGEDMSFQDYAIAYATDNLVLENVLAAKADELGLSLSEDARSEIDAYMEQIYEQYQGEEKFNDVLDSINMTPEYFRRQTEIRYLADELFAEFMGADGSELSDEDALNYINDSGYMHAKHILFKTVDDNNQPLSDEEIAEKHAQAEEVLSQLQACSASQLESKFDEFISEYGEDPGALYYTDGYYFRTGEMVEPFENAAKELEVGEISGIVESTYGYHILYRPAAKADSIVSIDSSGAPRTVRYIAAMELFSNMSADWRDAAEIEYGPIYEGLDFTELFGVKG